MVFLPVTQAVSVPFYMTLDLQLSFYRPLCYISGAHYLPLQCLCTTSTILAAAYSYLWYHRLNVNEKNSCHHVIPNLETFVYFSLSFSLLKNVL